MIPGKGEIFAIADRLSRSDEKYACPTTPCSRLNKKKKGQINKAELKQNSLTESAIKRKEGYDC
jgi:hypothetical protein